LSIDWRTTNNAQLPEIGKNILAVDPKYFRTKEIDLLIGNPIKVRAKLGWECKYDLPAVVKDMMQTDLKMMQNSQYLKDGGYSSFNYCEWIILYSVALIKSITLN
jgi:GDPmannose 4,6-dehydratase